MPGEKPAANKPSSAEVLQAAFRTLDRDRDGALTEAEYLAGSGPQRVRARDFKLFDFDASRTLSAEEFAAIPGPVPARDRGPIPDPFQDLLEAAVAAMDEAYGQWDRDPQLRVESHSFVQSFFVSLSSDGTSTVTTEAIRDADPDQNGQVTRDEARRFLEINLGIRRPSGHGAGQLLREPNGRVVSYALFIDLDQNQNGKIERTEFIQRKGAQDDPEAQARHTAAFGEADADRNGDLTYDEFVEQAAAGMNDPVEQFRRMDANLDALLDAAEIAAGTPAWQAPLVPMAFPAFDVDRSGSLTLAEYLLTPQANMVLPWQQKVPDVNRDDRLSFEEFSFGDRRFGLLRKLVYSRLDRDGDGLLTADEFRFEQRQPDALFVMQGDGTGWRVMTQSKDFPNCGSPAASPDGKWVAFDGYGPAANYSGSRIFIVSLEGQDRREVCTGLMPTWSPDGKRLACSRYENGSSVWIMNLDGTEDRKIGQGWGAQWSPDGKTIAFTRGSALILYDVAAETESQLLQAPEIGYSYLYYNMAWSPDSQRLCFKASKNNDQMELASIRATGDDRDLQVHYSGARAFDNDPCWSVDGRRLYFGLYSPKHKRTLLHEIDVPPAMTAAGKPAEPRLVKGQDLTVATATNACWTPDGQRLIIRARPQ